MFRDRRDAGRQLGRALRHLRGPDVVVLGLPRGGVPVAREVADELDAPLDVIIVRKLGLPQQPELAVGAVGEGGVRVLNADVVRVHRVSDVLRAIESLARGELDARARQLRSHVSPVPLRGKVAIVVDDGLATGASARAACRVARARGARHVVLAAPIGSHRTVVSLADAADEVVCPEQPAGFHAVGQGYDDFGQVSDDEVIRTLQRAPVAGDREPAPGSGFGPARTRRPVDADVVVDRGGTPLPGRLTVPEDATGVVLFAHGSGSSRHSPRNRHVAQRLNDRGLGTLLLDLLTPLEAQDQSLIFDIELLAGRLLEATLWMRAQQVCRGLPLGYFGASTGAGAALLAAADPASGVAAVVSRGGRPDLAGPSLARVEAPTLLIVGGRDTLVLDLNRRARAGMVCPTQLAVVRGATHLFEEPGALDHVARLAATWFADHFAAATRARSAAVGRAD